MVVPIGVPSKKTSTVLLFSAVPVMINSSSLVIPSVGLSPVSSVIPVTTGAAGGSESTVTEKSEEVGPLFPAKSVAWAVILYVVLLANVVPV